VRQTHSGKLPAQLCTALDNLSFATQNPGCCRECGRVMIAIDVQFWLYETHKYWNIKLPLCVECDSQAIKAIPGALAA
jgi:hypothetical protein